MKNKVKKKNRLLVKYAIFNLVLLILLVLSLFGVFDLFLILVGISGGFYIIWSYDQYPLNLTLSIVWGWIFYNVWFYFLSNESRKIRKVSWVIFVSYIVILTIITLLLGAIGGFGGL